MSRLLVVIAVICALGSHASGQDNLYEVCQRFDFPNDRDFCFETIRDGYFDLEAARFCVTRLTFASFRRQCLVTIKNKVYEDGALQACRSEYFDWGLNDCLARVGRDYVPPFVGDCSLRQARALVERSLAFIEAERVSAAVDTLLILREILAACR
jgi:hypothetical protein